MILENEFSLGKQICFLTPISENKIPKFLMFIFEKNSKSLNLMKYLILNDLKETSINKKKKKRVYF